MPEEARSERNTRAAWGWFRRPRKSWWDPPDPQTFLVGASPRQVCQEMIYWCIRGNNYASGRKIRFRTSASIVWALSLTLSAASTIILGLEDTLSFGAKMAFIFVALVTLVNGFEPYFNWRTRWVLSEAAQHEFYRLEEDLRLLLASTKEWELTAEELKPLYERYTKAWDDYGQQWLEARRNNPKG